MSRFISAAAILLWLGGCGADSEKSEGDSGPYDQDLDGYSGDSDCDDSDPTVNPGESEVCDGKDNDCDGVIDGVTATDATTWYFDQDGDGFGSNSVSRVACSQPISDGDTDTDAAFVEASGDCDDSDPTIYPGAPEVCDAIDNDCDDELDEGVKSVFYPDRDNDGYGVASAPAEACEAPTGYSNEKGDCDDSNPLVNIAADELCNGVDDDCDELVDEDDAADAPQWAVDRDEDGFGDFEDDDPDDGVDTVDVKVQCGQPIGYVLLEDGSEDDCDDFSADEAPDRLEVCDGEDNDCDGTTDEDDAEDAQVYFLDSDGDGYVNAAGTSTAACSPPTGFIIWEAGAPTDCDDGDANVNPGAMELCSTADDDDCDGVVNEADDNTDSTESEWTTVYADADGDGYGWAGTSVAACADTVPSGYVTDDTDCNDASAAAYPSTDPSVEICDGLDNDCNGDVDGSEAVGATQWYYDYDGDGYGDPHRTTTACEAPTDHVADLTDCNDADSAIHPAATEVCNGVDDDCDHDIDPSTSVDAGIYYIDLDGDGFGDASGAQTACTQPTGTVSDKTDCNDRNAAIFPGATEVCNGEDDDCDSSTPDPTTRYYFDEDEDGYGDPATSVDACSEPTTGGSWVEDDSDCGPGEPLESPDGFEVCDGLDNDCSGVTDDVGEYCLDGLSLTEVARYSDNTSAAEECLMVTLMTGSVAPNGAEDGELCGCTFILNLKVDTETFTPDDSKCSYIEDDLSRYEQLGIVDDLATDSGSCGTVTIRGLRDGSWRDIATAATTSGINNDHCEVIDWETVDLTDSGVVLELDVTVQVSGEDK